MNNTIWKIFSATAILFTASAATGSAHILHDHGTWYSGLAHPFLGVDHLLALFAGGLWAASLKKIPQIGGAFLFAMLTGGLLALATGLGALPGMELVITLSIFLLGSFLVMRWQAPVVLATVICATFALVHGYAHGVEMPAGVSFAGYFAGYLLSSGIILGTGALFGRFLKKHSTNSALRWSGVVVAILGLINLAA